MFIVVLMVRRRGNGRYMLLDLDMMNWPRKCICTAHECGQQQ